MNINQIRERKHNIWFFQTVISEQILKYTNMLNFLIHQFVHIEFSDNVLLILQNLEKTIWLR